MLDSWYNINMLLQRLQAKIKSKKMVTPEPTNIQDYLFSKLRPEVISWLESIKDDVLSVVRDVISTEVSSLRKGIKKGDKGDKGADSFVVGPMGPQGPKGDSIVGPIGPQGPVGPAGESIVGPQGPAGENGSPDTVDEIATKLNSKENIVDMSVIKGLREMFASMERAFNKKGGGATGGGMGNWIHESFAVTSATTTVTITNNVAANGNAILVRYNGQLLNHGVQYTISAKTITFTFTLDDDSNVGITYVRT